MNYEWRDGRLHLQRSAEERDPLIQRLRRIEGQVRGLQQMVEADRHCMDEMQQINAVMSALREVALILVSQHVAAGLERGSREGDAQAATEEIKAVIRAALRQP